MEMIAAMALCFGGFSFLLLLGEVIYNLMTFVMNKLEERERSK